MNKKTEYELLKLVAKEKGFKVYNENMCIKEYPYVYKESLFDENELVGYSEIGSSCVTFTEAIDYIMNYKKLSETWEEFISKHSNSEDQEICNELFEIDKRLEVIYKLEKLRDCYNDGWKPDWSTKNQKKHCIVRTKNEIVYKGGAWHYNPLHFKTKELAKEFLNNFEDLIKIYFEL